MNATFHKQVSADGDAELAIVRDSQGRRVAELYRLDGETTADALRIRVTQVLTALAEHSPK